MSQLRAKNIVLILARELASHIASPVFLVDPEGTLVYYNERAEPVLGQRFDQTGELRADEWGTKWSPADPVDGRPLPLEELPLYVALRDRKPATRPLRINALDGTQRVIDVVAFPLFASVDDFVGAVAIFWETTE